MLNETGNRLHAIYTHYRLYSLLSDRLLSYIKIVTQGARLPLSSPPFF